MTFQKRPDRARARPLEILFKPLELFLRIETAASTILFLAALIALLFANSALQSAYEHVWEMTLPALDVSLHFLINDGLMTIFFLVVGLEIRREMHDGVLASLRTAALPFAAALGGVVIPAVIYAVFNTGELVRRGWAVPTATDIAFAVGALAVLGKRVDPALRVLLLALAIVDDIAAILIIAFVYADGISIAGLGIAGLGVVVLLLVVKTTVRSVWFYLAAGCVVWYGLHEAGLHPALSGVILGVLLPAHDVAKPNAGARPALARLEQTLHPWVAFAVMPLFALANAGVNIGAIDATKADSMTLATGIFAGLVLGKPLGIVMVSALAVRLRLCSLPPGVTWGGIAVIACFGGIGFTMSIFISTLAFADPALLASAKLAVLLASIAAGSLGLLLGCFLRR